MTQRGDGSTPLATGDDVTTTTIETEVLDATETAESGAGSGDSLPGDAEADGSQTGDEGGQAGDAAGTDSTGGSDDADGSNEGSDSADGSDTADDVGVDGGDTGGDDGTGNGGSDGNDGGGNTGGGEEPVVIDPPEPDPADACFSANKSAVEVRRLGVVHELFE